VIKTFEEYDSLVNSVNFSPDGKKLISGPDDDQYGIIVWELETGKEIEKISGHPDSAVKCACFSHKYEGKDKAKPFFISGSSDKTIKLWDIDTYKVKKRIKSHNDTVTSISLSQDNKTLISGSEDMTLKIWDIDTGECIKTIPLLWIPTDIKFSPSDHNKFAVAGANSAITLFDLKGAS
jgi:WD40 repeat protein